MMWRHEIDLEEMLTDPIVQAVMRADGIDRGELDALLASIARVRGIPDCRVGKGAAASPTMDMTR